MNDQYIESLTEIIQARKSVFPQNFTGETIDQDAIDWILHNAIQAPSHRKVNPWRFYVIGEEKLPNLATFFQETYHKYVPAERFNEAKFESFPKKLAKTAHVILISMKPNPERPVPEWENVAAVACAVQNIYLSITAAGLGGYWSSPALMIRHIRDFFPLPEDETCLGFFYLGVPKAELPSSISQGEVSDYVQWL